ncbi:MAG TPA: phytanoyl-CoA dioxygenase family protein [Candidatus Dormibacteraeota bacterium]|nr:phytanoyl-CoA dioxygenase family protein [Candidatus Dormibacteraeota bacterium]
MQAAELDRHAEEYARDGLTVVTDAIPGPLLARMREQVEVLRAHTRSTLGPDATRPPGGTVGGRVLLDYGERIDTAPFAALAELPRLRRVVDRLLGTDFALDAEAFTVLFQRSTGSWCQRWHRDYRDNVPQADVERWRTLVPDLRFFNQFNAALYDDMSLWVVPGSHVRDDTPEEARVLAAGPPSRDGVSEEEYVVAASRYRRSMPGARMVALSAGDVAVYRDSALHLGHYIPTIHRATLHGHFENEVTRAFFTETFSLAR